MLTPTQKAISMSFVLWLHYIIKTSENYSKTFKWLEYTVQLLSFTEQEQRIFMKIATTVFRSIDRPLKHIYYITAAHYSAANMDIKPLLRYTAVASKAKKLSSRTSSAVTAGRRLLYFRPWTYYISGKDLVLVIKFLKRYRERIAIP